MTRIRRLWPAALFGLVAYVPLLLTAPGEVAADTKTYLYLDPARLLGRAASMWDPNVGLGTVTHQTIGYLWPMGPWYWLFEAVGSPDWVAQRLWLGTVMAAAGVGVWWLLRTLGIRSVPAVVAAALLYELSPYALHYAARISVLLLPWAALPWLIGLTQRTLQARSWRHPAAFALIVATVGGVNATALVLAGLGPLLWLPFAVLGSREATWRQAWTALWRIGLLTTACSLWWIAGLAVQGGWGIDILRYTETVETVARTSLASEVLRGLGYWFFYGGDKLGPWIEPGRSYTQDLWLIAVGFVPPVLALASAVLVRWRHRGYFVALLVLGTAVAVGAYPYAQPSPIGGLFKSFATTSTAGLALRSTPRAVPLVVLAIAALVAAGLAALRRRGVAAGVAVGLVAVLGIPPLWTGAVIGENLQRPEEIPSYWEEAAAHLDAAGTSTRVLALPGTDFASYRWGNTVDPILPFLVDRPYVARELIPYGTPPSADLLNALDRRLQEGVLDTDALAPVARLLGVGDVVLRADLQYERYKTPRPTVLWSTLKDVAGFGPPTRFGEGVTNRAIERLPLRDEVHLATPPGAEEPPAVAAFPVDDPLPIVRTRSAASPVIVAGDGEGVVEAAAAGLLDGDGAVLYSAALPDGATDADDAVLVLTDTNRKRGRRWATVRDNTGYTEPAGHEPLRDDPSDARLPVFPDAPESAFTTMELSGVESVRASDYGNRVTFSPGERPARAIDGDPTTQWEVAAFSKTVGERWEVRLTDPVPASTITLLQPPFRNRWITKVGVLVNGEKVGSYDLQPGEQTIDLGGAYDVDRLELVVEGDNIGKRVRYDGLSGVGFAEVRIGDADVRATEMVHLPTDLLADADRTGDHPLAIVLARLRANPQEPVRTDEEPAIVRTFELDARRSFSLSGEARISAFVPDDRVDELLASGAPVARSSRRLPGHLPARASAAFDGRTATAWQAGFGEQVGEWIEVEGVAEPVTSLTLDVVADGEHSVPTMLRVGDLVVDVPPIPDGTDRGHTERVTIPLPSPVPPGLVRITVEDARPVLTTDWHSEQPITMPVGIAEVDLPLAASFSNQPLPCRDDLLTIDGEPVGIRAGGLRDDRSAGTVELCAGEPLVLGPGEHVLRAAPGTETGIDLDRLVLATDDVPFGDGGGPTAAEGATVTVEGEGRTSFDLAVDGADEPVWLVLGQSHSLGWTATADGADLGEPVLVDGYANGWLLPAGTTSVHLEWTPQRYVWAGLALSVLAAVACLAIAVLGAVPRRGRRAAAPGSGAVPLRVTTWAVGAGPGARPAVGWAVLVGVVAALVAQPYLGAVVAVATVVALRWRRGRLVVGAAGVLCLGAAAAFVLAKQLRNGYPPDFGWPELFGPAHHLAWAALLLVGAVVVADRVRGGTPVVESIAIDAPRDRVWAALADPSPWWPDTTLDPTVGGAFVERWDGQVTTGEVLEVAPGEVLRLSWSDDGWSSPTDVTIELRGSTDVTVTHAGWSRLPDGAALAAAHAEGWRHHLEALKRHVEGGEG